MKKLSKIITTVLLICLLFSCSKSKEINLNPEQKPDTETITVVKPVDLSNEAGIRDYLIGEWLYNQYNRDQIFGKMIIDKDLNVSLSFTNTTWDNPKGDFKGKISFDHAYVDPDQTPDLIILELFDSERKGGVYFFLHRTIYDNKRVMSWFRTGDEDSIFYVGDNDEEYLLIEEEIIFEKVTSEKPKTTIRKNDEFYAVYWGVGKDEKSLWLDDVIWIAPKSEFSDLIDNYKMYYYENDIRESLLYQINVDQLKEILGEDLTESFVYFVETDSEGKITNFIDAEYKNWVENNYVTKELNDRIFRILEEIDEVNEYIELGMIYSFEGDIVMIDGDEYYQVILGTQQEDYFVNEIFYAVDDFTKAVYKYDVIFDTWDLISNN